MGKNNVFHAISKVGRIEECHKVYPFLRKNWVSTSHLDANWMRKTIMETNATTNFDPFSKDLHQVAFANTALPKSKSK